MSNKKYLKQQHHNIIVDMGDFIMQYGDQKLNHSESKLSETIYSAAKNDLKGLDRLFKDKGFGRTEKFFKIGEGYINDMYVNNLRNDLTPEQIHQKAEALAKEAIEYLGNHPKEFDKWELA
ncbi:hypothetical protein WR164_05270 [Philodulcilactobacillus myokoensis]|uniref:Uncharacterized protein n=1 Tax=Philodulcilactobacillus myokoensis TaxID=2929573 RepID=A0A9W6B0U8_9LACO|nr:hypothetical protein [Philodulcilactobacillus myokoensis]GLB46548.1 hypothetical protein WR164_05270 [Philodulcilactobacillus myokoensis]